MRGSALLLVAVIIAGCAGSAPTGSPGSSSAGHSGVPVSSSNPQATASPEPGTSTTSSSPSTEPAQVNQTAPPGVHTWAAPDAATIRPGVRIVSSAGQCTSNFIFTSPDNATVYIGVAAHCVNNTTDATGTATSGCDKANTPMKPGTEVQVSGASAPGKLVYTSWGTMQAGQEANADACDYNDFAVIQLNATDAAKANPAMLWYGGPTGMAATTEIQAQMRVLTFGNSDLRLGVAASQHKEGYIVSTGAGGWTTTIYTAPPGVEGDSGSAVILADGRAVGDLVTGELAPLVGASGVSTLQPELTYARNHAGLELRLATWGLLNHGILPPV